MKFIFLIAAEHQLFQVRAAIDHFKIETSDLMLVVLEIGDTSYIERLKASKDLGSIYIFPNWTSRSLFFNRLRFKPLIRFCQSLRRTDLEYTFFSSHYDSDPDLLFFSILKPKMYYLMDEGTASFSVQEKRKKQARKTLSYLIKSILYGQSIKLPRTLKYFTQYNLDAHKVDEIEKYKIKKNDNPLKRFTEGVVNFVGTSIVEVGYLKQEDYLSFLTKIYADLSGSKVLYYPHRKETQSKLLLIDKIGFTINKIDEPFETMFAKLEESPSLFCSPFVTGVLDNISKANEKIPELRIYKFDSDLLIQHKEVYENIYKEMRTNENLNFVTI